MAFKKATKKQAKLKMAITGPSGGGKTYTALRIASGLCKPGQRIAVIDTEKGSASKYAGNFDFDVSNVVDFSATSIMREMDEAADAGYGVLIIDSLTHSWQWLKEEVEKYAKAKCRGNTYMAWAYGTPIWSGLMQSILDYPGHVLVTMRSKTEYVLEEYVSNGSKKTRPVKVGMAPETRSGTEYEFDIQLELTYDHYATVSKDRTNTIDGQTFDKPSEEIGEKLLTWLEDGEKPIEDIQHDKFMELMGDLRDAESLSELQEIYTEALNQGFPSTWKKQLADTKDACKLKLATEKQD